MLERIRPPWLAQIQIFSPACFFFFFQQLLERIFVLIFELTCPGFFGTR
jgi:hypothetical protein